MSRDLPALAPAPPGVRVPAACRLCGQPLSALARLRGDVCDAMDCRRRAMDEVTRARRVARMEELRATAAHAWTQPALADAPVLWLRDHEDEFATPSPIDLDDLRAHLMALESDPVDAPAFGDPAPEPEHPAAALSGRLCALCRGRCCRFGLHGRAFLRATQLRDWLSQHPGTTWVDAVDHYLAWVPADHLHSSCLFHGRAGCTLPRERRSQVCNEYACDTLEQLRDVAGPDPAAMVVVGIVASHVVHGAAVLTAHDTRRLA